MFDEVNAMAEVEKRNRLRRDALLPLLSVHIEIPLMRAAHEE